MIDEIKQELQDFVYPDDNSEALEQLRNKPISSVSSIAAPDLLEYLTTNKKIAMIHACANDEAHDLQNQCRGLLIAIQSGFSIDLSKSGNASTLSGFVPNIINDVQAGEIISKATKVDYPFASVTMQQFRQAKGLTNSIDVNGWIGQRFLKVTISGTIDESFRPVLTKSNDYYDSEPVGRTTTISKSGDHIIDLSNLQNPGAPTTITIELGSPNSFTVELV